MHTTRRISCLARQIQPQAVQATDVDTAEATTVLLGGQEIPDRCFEDSFEGKAAAHVATVLPGPLQQNKTKREVLKELSVAGDSGANYAKWREIQEEYCHQGASSNFVVPTVIRSRKPGETFVTNRVVLCHEEDCERIAKNHVKKDRSFLPFLGTSVISTTDNESWRKQRETLTEAFMPSSSLAEVFDISVERARVARP